MKLKKLMARLRGRKGETLVESLAAILVFTLSSIILLTMVSAATGLNRAAKIADENRQTQLAAAETGGSEVCRGTVRICFNENSRASSTPRSYDVSVCREAPGALYAYFRAAPQSAADTEP